ncbi:thioredoxin [Oceanotoga teriensis]|uniref:Thioredoxin n=1 Tax=Oceanotoga teriensis TaxID=515440 RepID=A0AA45HIX9_9BACT|nr:thioredoxin family protein [Oceanotoga teriensis]PWJ95213.1 thioredoxin [Oceanotoga teriensis]
MNLKYFISENCGVCHAMEPKIKKIAEELKINFEVFEISKNKEISGQLLIFTVPVLILFNDNLEIKRWVRNFSMIELKKYLIDYKSYFI